MCRNVLMIILAALVLWSCATPRSKRPEVSDVEVQMQSEQVRDMYMKKQLDLHERLAHVGFPLLAANADLCGERVMYDYGIKITVDDEWAPDWQPSLQRVLGVGDQPALFTVGPGSPADKAGLRPGDAVIYYNNVQVKKGEDGAKELIRWLAEDMKDSKPVILGIKRMGLPSFITLEPVKVCGYPILLEQNDEFNAFANGEHIVVYTGLLKELPDDNHVAMIIGHELAHNVMEHRELKKQNVALGMLADLTLGLLTGVYDTTFQKMGAQAYSQDKEQEADYVGMYFTVRAGFDVSNAGAVWEMMGIEHPERIGQAGTTHPGDEFRSVFLDKTWQEIQGKQAQGLPLIPDMQEGKEAPWAKSLAAPAPAEAPQASSGMVVGSSATSPK